MQLSAMTDFESGSNPIDLVEDFAEANNWAFERPGLTQMTLLVQGNYCHYLLMFAWQDEAGLLHFSCTLDTRIPMERQPATRDLVTRVNERLPIGHFDLSSDDATLLFRQTLLLRGANGVAVEQIEDLLDTALQESERVYPALQFVVWGGRSPDQAMAAAIFDTVGEA